jgi:hypothetical protein
MGTRRRLFGELASTDPTSVPKSEQSKRCWTAG